MSMSELHRALLDEGGSLAASLVAAADVPPSADGPPQLAAEGPRASARRSEYELLLEMILEGSLLHYGQPRIVRCADPDLALLLGDQLYALGLSRLAALGDLDAVSELADLISLLAQAEAGSDGRLAAAIWQAGAVAIGWGPGPQHEAAKALARAGDDGAAAALEQACDGVASRTS